MAPNLKISTLPKSFLLKAAADVVVEKLDQSLKDLIEKQSTSIRLREAMLYAVLDGGKRFRPLLIKASGDLFGIAFEVLLPIAISVELVHAYSLVHDDLPAMDNADTRRGKPSCWRQFDEATAILAGDALLTLAFEQLSSFSLDPVVVLEIITKFSKAIGPQGMVGGQMLDITQDHHNNPNLINRLQQLKTGELIAFCCEVGAIVGHQHPSLKNQLKDVGYKMGLIYQIIDDLLDKKAEADLIGKPCRHDINKVTLVDQMGEIEIVERVNSLKQEILTVLTPFDSKADLFRDILVWSLERTF